MSTQARTIQILDPCPEEVPEEIGISGTVGSLEGKVIGLLENRKHHADSFMQELQRVLETDYRAKKVIYANKFTFSAPCSEETLDMLAQECDVVIHGIAD
jgi:hypothetical protein